MQKYFQKGWRGEKPLLFPLVDGNLPEGGEHSDLVSPRVGDPHGLERPLYPGDDGFDEALAEVVEVRMMVLKGRWPADFLKKHHPRADFDPMRIPVPLRRTVGHEADPVEAARSVVGDHPLTTPIQILGWLMEQNPEPKKYEDTGHEMFLENTFFVPENLADRLKRNAIKGVEAKYWFGLARPEEVMGMMGSVLTASIHGCPCHPSYPALHATAAASVSQAEDDYYLKLEWIREIFDSVYHHSMYRTLGAFHYAQDNIAGMKLGGMWDEFWTQ